MHFGTQDDLLSRLAYSLEDDAARPLAFLTGAGLSLPSVPGVNETLVILRGALPEEDRPALDELLAKYDEPGEKYRQAFQFAAVRRPSSFSERILKFATLRAFDSAGYDPVTLLSRAAELETQLERWRLPAGQASLGRLLVGLPSHLRGPVLTTNFDPLTEIAVRNAGGSATPHIHTDDSSFIANLRVQAGVSVVHLHGFWRDAAVLNTSDQLSLVRPSLAESLKVILEQHTLVVIGYGGWTDVVTRSLLDVVARQRAENLDVLWCLFRSEIDLERASTKEPAIGDFESAPGNIHFYAGIDANTMFPAVEKRVAGVLNYTDVKRSSTKEASLIGWTNLTRTQLESASRGATRSAALAFFDGRLPTWHDAVSPMIPQRHLSVQIGNEIRASAEARSSSISVVTGPSGEGKSTIALQVAAAIAADDPSLMGVLVLEGDHFGATTAVLDLPRDRQYLLVIDEAHRFAREVEVVAREVHATGRSGLHFLLISRDTDWISSGGANFAWDRYVTTKRHNLQGIDHVDAASLVSAWERLGEEALGELSHYATSEDRIEALLEFAFGEGVAGRGTLLGALLSARYDRAGLREHIRELMDRLRGRLVSVGRPTSLLDALVMIAVPHAYGVLELDRTVLADALEISNVELHAHVLIPLGEEAAIAFASGRIVVRHELIASAIIDVCLQIGYDLNGAVRSLVRAAAANMRRSGYASGLSSIAYLSSRITDIPNLALAAAQAAVDANPNRLSYHTSMSAVQRKMLRRADLASATAERALPLLVDAQNADQARPYFTEWGVCEGILGKLRAKRRSRWRRNSGRSATGHLETRQCRPGVGMPLAGTT